MLHRSPNEYNEISIDTEEVKKQAFHQYEYRIVKTVKRMLLYSA